MLYHASTLYPALGQVLSEKLPILMPACQGQECYLHFMEGSSWGSERLESLPETTWLAAAELGFGTDLPTSGPSLLLAILRVLRQGVRKQGHQRKAGLCAWVRDR